MNNDSDHHKAGCATADIPARYHTLSNTRATLLIHDVT